jgi:hypothetical protein
MLVGLRWLGLPNDFAANPQAPRLPQPSSGRSPRQPAATRTSRSTWSRKPDPIKPAGCRRVWGGAYGPVRLRARKTCHSPAGRYWQAGQLASKLAVPAPSRHLTGPVGQARRVSLPVGVQWPVGRQPCASFGYRVVGVERLRRRTWNSVFEIPGSRSVTKSSGETGIGVRRGSGLSDSWVDRYPTPISRPSSEPPTTSG